VEIRVIRGPTSFWCKALTPALSHEYAGEGVRSRYDNDHMRNATRWTVRGLVILLWITLLIGWARSYLSWDEHRFLQTTVRSSGRLSLVTWSGEIQSSRGSIAVSISNCNVLYDPTETIDPVEKSWSYKYDAHIATELDFIPTREGRRWQRGPFAIGHEYSGWDVYLTDTQYIRLPYWLLVGALSLPVFRWGIKTYRTMRLHRRAGLCQQCGYDLRATPDRCPECGAVPSPCRAG
jgi:hypothetical protein